MIQFNELKVLSDDSKIIVDASIKDLPFYKDVYIKRVIIDNQDTYLSSGPSNTPIYTKDFIDEFDNNKVNPVDLWGDMFLGDLLFMPELSRLVYIDGIFQSTTIVDGNFIRLTIDAKKYYYKGINEDINTVNDAFYVNKDTGELVINDKIVQEINPKDYFLYKYGSKSIRTEINKSELLTSNLNNIYFVYIETEGVPTADTPCGMDNSITLGVTTNLYPIYQQGLGYIKELENSCNIPKNFINYLLQFKALELSIRTGHYQESLNLWNRLFKTIDSTITSKCGCYG